MYLKLMIGLALLVLCMCIEIWRELHSFRVVTYKITSKKLKGIKEARKIIFLSDLHNHVYGDKNRKLIQKIDEIDPDLILIGGDMLVGKKNSYYGPALEFVKAIAEKFPVYYASGNHEQRMREIPENYCYSYPEYKKELAACGVCFLENASMEFLFDECPVNITGLEIPVKCYRHFYKEELSDQEITERIGIPRKDAYQILLAHNPGYMKEYLRWGADLVLSGHLHGGIVRIPGIAGVISPAFDIFPKYSGDHYKEGDTDIVVSKGLGVHTICVRLFNPAEVVVLRLDEE